MTIQEFLRVLRGRYVLVVSVVVVAMIGAGVTWWLRPPEYTSNLTMYVSAQATDSANAAYQGSLLSEQRVSSYVRLVGSTKVSGEVIRDLGLAATPEAVAAQISASSPPDSVLLDVAAVGRSPEDAAAIANSVGRVFVTLVAELERPSAPGGVPPVVVRVVEPAAVPTTPSSAGLALTLALGLLVGAGVGLALAFASDAMDTSVTSLEELHTAAGVPNLGIIAYDGNVPKRPLTVHDDPLSPRTEAFRQLRTNLQYVDVDNPRKVIVVTSALPGEGKTTLVCNLAIAIAAADTRVLVVDADLRRPRLAGLLGLEGSAGLTDVLAGRRPPEQVIQPWSGGPFDVLASGPLPPNPSELLAARQMESLMGDLRDRYDVVLVDSAPLLPVTDTAAMAPGTDGAIMVCRFKKTTREQVSRGVAALAAVSVPVLGTVFTMVPRSESWMKAYCDSYYYDASDTSERSTLVVTEVLATGRHMADADRGYRTTRQ